MKTMVLAALRGYKRFLSPMLPGACRYLPTCSEYAMEAVERHGVFFWQPKSRVARIALSAVWRQRIRSRPPRPCTRRWALLFHFQVGAAVTAARDR